jgi:hypothetical protein
LATILAVVVVLAVIIKFNSRRPVPQAEHHNPVSTDASKQPKVELATHDDGSRPQHAAAQRRPRHSVERAIVSKTVPKLDQFPSPQPLSEEERVLLRYVTVYPERAGLLAEARTKALHQDAEERLRLAAGEEDSQR